MTVAVLVHTGGRHVVQGHSSMTDTVQPLVIVGGGLVLGSPSMQVVFGTIHAGQGMAAVGVTVIVAVLSQSGVGMIASVLYRTG